MVEEARLESVYTSKGYHGFESRSLRSLKDSRFRLSSFVYMCALSQNKGNPFGLPFLFALLHHIFLAVADIEARTGSSDVLT